MSGTMHAGGVMGSGMWIGMGIWWLLLLLLIVLGIAALVRFLFGGRG
jgi:hypothetical protein